MQVSRKALSCLRVVYYAKGIDWDFGCLLGGLENHPINIYVEKEPFPRAFVSQHHFFIFDDKAFLRIRFFFISGCFLDGPSITYKRKFVWEQKESIARAFKTKAKVSVSYTKWLRAISIHPIFQMASQKEIPPVSTDIQYHYLSLSLSFHILRSPEQQLNEINFKGFPAILLHFSTHHGWK